MGMLGAYLSEIEQLTPFVAAATVLELLLPSPRVGLASRARGAFFMALSISGYALAWAIFVAIQTAWPTRPFLQLARAPLFVQIAAIYLAQDLFYYCQHRLQHRSAFLWRFHSVHHSIRELSVASSYHHWTEELLGHAFIRLPIWLLLGISPTAAAVSALLISAHAAFLHAATRLHFGKLRAVVADNRFHRIHDSLEVRHWNRNYGLYTTVWDRLFGTAYFPASDEIPATGLANQAEPRSLIAYALSGFLKTRPPSRA